MKQEITYKFNLNDEFPAHQEFGGLNAKIRERLDDIQREEVPQQTGGLLRNVFARADEGTAFNVVDWTDTVPVNREQTANYAVHRGLRINGQTGTEILYRNQRDGDGRLEIEGQAVQGFIPQSDIHGTV